MKMDDEWVRDVGRALSDIGFLRVAPGVMQRVGKLIRDMESCEDDESWLYDNNDATKPTSEAQIYKRRQRVRDDLARASGMMFFEDIYGAPTTRAQARARGLLSLTRLLRIRGYSNAALVTAHNADLLCTRFHLTDLRCDVLLEQLEMHVAMNDRKLVDKTKEEIRKLNRQSAADAEARILHSEAKQLVHEYPANPKSTSSKMEVVVNELRILDNNCGSFNTRLSRYRVELYLQSLLGDPHQMMMISSIASDWLKKYPHAQKDSYMLEFAGTKMSAGLMLSDFESAHEAWNHVEQQSEPGTPNWSGFLQLYFIVCSSSGAFDKAATCVARYFDNPVEHGHMWRHQLWNIYKAILDILIEDCVIQPPVGYPTQKLNYSELEEQCSDAADDKVIGNVLLQIVRVFDCLSRKDYDSLIKSTSKLRVYASRYLNKRQTQRTGLFIRKLCCLEAAEFKPEAAQVRAHKIEEKYPEAKVLLRDDAEIIPYDTMWSLVLKRLS